MDNPFVVTSVRSMRPYARRVVECLRKEREFADSQYDIDYTEALDAKTFADGEMEVELGKSVRGRNVVLFCNSSRNDAGISLSECKQELYHAIDVLQRSQAKKIIVFEPYVSCSRSDRTTRRNSVGFWVHYKTLLS
ncbi:MAG: ribose-phosphate pyrophosphokinase-like domain-containing protein [Spirochaetaceae bacterium]|jgi:ribose-phosphate pyrophosphokinase|nr:ribose-phosphate pyrophosphokinase-like domain-containing protein [Spirochaetaceae bacterium]